MAQVQLATRIDARVKKAIEMLCETRGLKMNRFIEEALIDKLEELEDVEDLKTLDVRADAPAVRDPERPQARWQAIRIEVSATAEKQIRKLDRDDQIRVVRAIQSLATETTPTGSRKVRGYDDVFRIRVGTYRSSTVSRGGAC